MVSMQMRWTTVGRYSSEDKVVYHLLYIYVHYVARNSCFTVQDDRFEDNIAASNNSVQTLLPRRNCYYKCARDWLGIVEPMVGQYLVSRGIGENDIKRIPSAVIVPLTRGDSRIVQWFIRSPRIYKFCRVLHKNTAHRTWNTVHLLDDAYMADSLPSFYQLDSRRSLIISGLQYDLVAVNVPCS